MRRPVQEAVFTWTQSARRPAHHEGSVWTGDSPLGQSASHRSVMESRSPRRHQPGQTAQREVTWWAKTQKIVWWIITLKLHRTSVCAWNRLRMNQTGPLMCLCGEGVIIPRPLYARLEPTNSSDKLNVKVHDENTSVKRPVSDCSRYYSAGWSHQFRGDRLRLHKYDHSVFTSHKAGKRTIPDKLFSTDYVY